MINKEQASQAIKFLASLKEKLGPILEEEGPLETKFKKIGVRVKNEILPIAWNFIKNIFSSRNVFSEDVDILSFEKLVEISKCYIVEGANEVAALKQFNEDTFYIYLAYCKDRNLIDEDKNKYVIIKADGLSKEVKELFSESDLIILN